ncbi:MAG TPA: ATP-binding protein, partial [Verrucomicrobiae bacterium]|nr:ATP-binding protein [Verrucomicrobiae bacterium]
QAKLREAERLAIIGQTAAMVGHDIRNPLQAIIGDLYLLRDEVKNMTDDNTRKSMLESIEAIDENILYINKIVSDLQDYTRQLKPNIEEFNLKDLVDNVLLMIKVTTHVTTEVIIDSNLTVKSDAAFLRRVLTNLVLNATQAMEKGGKLIVAACPSANKVVITVKDSGVGIPEEVKKNLFMPLFTTKSKGQGLGLAVVKRLVEALNGTVKFESEKDNGTQFIIELPG